MSGHRKSCAACGQPIPLDRQTCSKACMLLLRERSMVGLKFGHLTVIGPAPKRRRYAQWHCVCVCGRTRVVPGVKLRSGRARSCGLNHDPYERRAPVPSPIELAWAAGLFEGEGTVRIAAATHNSFGHLAVSVVNTDRQVIDWFQRRWPARTRPATGLDPNRQKPAWVWSAHARIAVPFLQDILPYVVRDRVRERITHALAYQAGKRTDFMGMAPEEREEYVREQWEAYMWMRELNSRGANGRPANS